MGIRFIVDGEPVSQPRQKFVAQYSASKGKHVPVARGDNTHAIVGYKLAVRLTAAVVIPTGWVKTTPMRLIATFVFRRPAAMKAGPRFPHCVRPDTDNLLKAVADGMTGMVFADDKQVFAMAGEKWYAATGERPHTEIEVSYIE